MSKEFKEYLSKNAFLQIEDERYGKRIGNEFWGFQDLSLKLHEAIRFAEEKHRGQKRKGTEINYIIHPLEVLQILCGENCSLEVAIAGVLHDVVEDTDGTIEEIKEQFGERVAFLVSQHTEKKAQNGSKRTWKERKEEMLEHLLTAERDVKQIVLADSVSNLRSMVYDYHQIGDKLWERFNGSRDDIAWVYSKKIDAFDDFQTDADIHYEYWELNSLYKHLFVDFYIVDTDEEQAIFQVSLGEVYSIEPEFMMWIKVDVLPENAKLVSKEIAERLEDLWKEGAKH